MSPTMPTLLRSLLVLLASAAVAPAADASRAEPRGAAGHSAALLRFVPHEADAILGFERPAGRERLFERLRDELLYALRVDETLASLTGSLEALDASGLVVASLARASARPQTLALWRSPNGPEAVASILFPLGSAPACRPKSCGLRVGPADAAGERRLGLAALPGGALAFGDLDAVERCLERATARATDLSAHPTLLSALEAARDADVWGVLLPGWYGFNVSELPPSLPDPGVARSLAGIQSSLLLARVASQAVLRFDTRTAEPRHAAVLADALRAFLGSFRQNPDSAAAVLASLEQARVASEDNSVSLLLPLTAEALDRIKRNEASRQLLSWRLGPEERERRQRAGEVLDLLALRAGDRVADVGAGSGFHTLALAWKVGDSGKVYSVDIDEKAVAELRRRADEASLRQVEVVLGAPDDPRLPAGALDAVLIVNTYHEMPHHARILEHLRTALKAGGRLVILEPASEERRKEPREVQEARHEIAPELVEADLQRAGFSVVRRIDDFVRETGSSRFEWLILAQRVAGED